MLIIMTECKFIHCHNNVSYKGWCYIHVIGGDKDTTNLKDFFRELLIHARYRPEVFPTLDHIYDNLDHLPTDKHELLDHVLRLDGSRITPLFKMDLYYTLCKYFDHDETRIFLNGKGPQAWIKTHNIVPKIDQRTGWRYVNARDVTPYCPDVLGQQAWIIETYMCLTNSNRLKK